MRLYRMAKLAHAHDLGGTGGLFGSGRWHRQGTRILYTSEHVSLAKLEVLANSPILPRNYGLVTLELPDTASIQPLEIGQLPSDWAESPAPESLLAFSGAWLGALTHWVLRVPSVHSPNEYNFLLNPLHPEHAGLRLVSIEPHPFDARLK